MNIKQAKEQIQNAITAYFTRDAFGSPVIPVERQRPVFLVGPPGIGKTAIMEQIAQELGVGLVSYSMTHHTRQSAIGLPFIVQKTYGGVEYSVSEYTMSEIIASVYDMIAETGHKEGILFLDEVNCVSETLAPAMLQFLQYKIFGRHRVPDGWIIVTAGNPPEYNNSVREFDIVTWDRLKRVEIEPDYDVWKEYAYKKGIHAAVITYLDIKKDHFYKIETTVDGKSFVTARGWADLSDMIRLYEAHGISVDENLVGQYLQNPKIAKEFAMYYDLFNKYRLDYQIPDILNGKASGDIRSRAKNAKFDERLSLLGLILDALAQELRAVCREEGVLTELLHALKNVKLALGKPDISPVEAVQNQAHIITKKIENGKKAGSLSEDAEFAGRRCIAELENMAAELAEKSPANGQAAFAVLKAAYEKMPKKLKKKADAAKKQMEHVFAFCEDVFADGQELLILVTELTMNYYSAHFISRYGCEAYFKHNKELLFYERQKDILKELENFDLED